MAADPTGASSAPADPRGGRSLFLLLLLTAIGLLGALRVPIETSIELMLPEDSPSQRMVRFLRDANFSEKVVIDLAVTNEHPDTDALIRAADEFAARLSPPLVTRATANFADLASAQDAVFFFTNMPQILAQADLDRVDGLIHPPALAGVLRERYLQLLKPGGSFMAAAIRSDPLDLRSIILDRIRLLAPVPGYRGKLYKGHLVSEDGRHTLVVLDTSVRPMDSQASARLFAYVRDELARLPENTTWRMAAAHLHSLSNERMVRRDIILSMSVVTVVFVVLFLFVFRDPRTFYVFLIPVVTGLLAVDLASLFVGPLSNLVMGLGAAVTGIAIDYGIHVYVAVRDAHDRRRALRFVMKPVTLGALTTMGAFAAFFFSRIRGHQQMAWVVILTIAFSLACAFLILPGLVRRRPRHAPHTAGPALLLPARGRARITAFLWLLAIAAALILASGTGFDTSILRLDGTEQDIRDMEAQLQEVWGKGLAEQGILVVHAADAEAAREISDAVYAAAAPALGSNRFLSLSALWPSRRTREENAARWTAFWSAERTDILRQELKEEGKVFSFSADAFDPFFAILHMGDRPVEVPASNGLYARFQERYEQARPDGYQVLSLYPDTAENERVLDELCRKHPEAYLVSPRTLSKSLSDTFSTEVVKVSLIGLGFVLLVAFVSQRRPVATLVSLVPPVTAVVGMLAVLRLVGSSLSIANTMAGIIVFGLSIDYGICLTHSYGHAQARSMLSSVTLSAITTCVGAGALLLARHPALSSIGLTITSGVLIGYLSSILVVPSLASLFLGRHRKEAGA